MTRKIHLRRNKNPEIKVLAACAPNPYIDGSRRNGRQTYQFMASEIVGWGDFLNVADSDRAHCCEAALIVRNRQRRAKGLTPVATPFEGCR